MSNIQTSEVQTSEVHEDRFAPGSDDWYRQEAALRAQRLTELGRERLAQLADAVGVPTIAIEHLSGQAQCVLTWLAVWDDSITAGMLDVLAFTRDLAYGLAWQTAEALNNGGLPEIAQAAAELAGCADGGVDDERFADGAAS